MVRKSTTRRSGCRLRAGHLAKGVAGCRLGPKFGELLLAARIPAGCQLCACLIATLARFAEGDLGIGPDRKLLFAVLKPVFLSSQLTARWLDLEIQTAGVAELASR